jgi:hypothetical protein
MASRINFKTIIAKYSKLGKGNVRLTQSSLYLTKPISPNTTVYNFDVLETQATTLQNNEIRLNLNDEFIIASMSMGIECSMLIGDGRIDSGAKYLLTYAPFEQNSAEAVKLANFYAGALQISVNNVIFLDKYDTRRAQITPTTEFGSATAGIVATQPSIDWSKDSFYGNEPLLTLSGAKKNQITINLPTAISVAQFSGVDNALGAYTLRADRVFFFARGLNAQNGAVFQN